MEFHTFEKIINLISYIYEWKFNNSEDSINEFNSYLLSLESEFRDEVSKNLYHAIGYLEKEILIKKYLNEFAQYKIYVFNKVLYEEDESENDHLAPKEIFLLIKNSQQDFVDIICEQCFKHKIDLTKISNESNFVNLLNLSLYDEFVSELITNNDESNHINFIKIFTSTKAYDFYKYLLIHFEAPELVKHSTIYHKMVLDGFIDVTIRPERYKRLAKLSKHKIDIEHSLKVNNDIGKKTLAKYDELKDFFFN